MKILVTGGAGYIGSILVPQLLNLNHKVIVVDNFMYNQNSLLNVCVNKNLNIIRHDVCDTSFMKDIITHVDCVLPLACYTGAPLCDKNPIAAREVNYKSVKRLSKLMSKNQLLILPTTNSGYGVGEDDIYCDEKSLLNPISLYGRLKVKIEQFLMDNTKCISFRFATLFGTSPRMRIDLLLNNFTYKAVTDGFLLLYEPTFKRNFLHVRDAASAFLHGIVNYDSMKGNIYNVGLSNANLSKEELCQKIKGFVPSFQYTTSDFGSDPDKRNYIVSNEKIESTGFVTEFDLDDGIVDLIKGYNIIKRNQYSNI